MDPRVEQTIRLMKANLALPLLITRIARSQNLSRSRLDHIFKEGTGLTPMQYLRRLQLEAAKDMLEKTSIPIKEIMLKVGMNDKNDFRRQFRRAYQASPAAFRKSCQESVKQKKR